MATVPSAQSTSVGTSNPESHELRSYITSAGSSGDGAETATMLPLAAHAP